MRLIALLLGAVTAVVTIAWCALWVLHPDDWPEQYVWRRVSGATLVAVYVGVGMLLVQRRPRNVAGWFLITTAAVFSFGLARAVASALGWPVDLLTGFDNTLLFGLVLLIAPLYLPNGQLPSPRWRWVNAVIVLLVLGVIAHEPIERSLSALEAPIVAGAILALIFVVVTPWVAILSRYGNSAGVERQQVKWLLAAMLLILISFLFAFLPVGADRPEAREAIWVMLNVSMTLLPIAIAFSVLRYQLYRIDGLISGAVVYGVMTLVLAGAFAALDGVVSDAAETLLGTDTQAGVVLTTLLLVGAFGPLKSRVQEFVDHRLRPPVPGEDLAGLRAQLRFTADAHAPIEMAAQLLEETIATFDAVGGRITLYDQMGGLIVRSAGVAVTAVQVALPLEIGGRRIGMLELGPRRGERAYDRDDLQLLGQVYVLVGRSWDAFLRAHGEITAGPSVPTDSKV